MREKPIEIIRRWNTKEFIKENVEKIGKVFGVLILIAESGSINYICSSGNLGYTLSLLLDQGEVPAKKFKAYQTKNASSANDLADRLKKKYEPYYNMFIDNDYEKGKPIMEE